MVQRMVQHDQVSTVNVKVSADSDVGESKDVEVPVVKGAIILSDLRRLADDAAVTTVTYDAPNGQKNQSCRTTDVIFPPGGARGSWNPWPILVASETTPRPPSPKPQKAKICVIKDEIRGKHEWKKIVLTRDWFIKKEDFDGICSGNGNMRLWSWSEEDSSFVESAVETLIHPPREAAARAWLHPDIIPTYGVKT